MAGSYQHCVGDNGDFDFETVENMGDAYEACLHMFLMIKYLTRGHPGLIQEASDAAYADINAGNLLGLRRASA